MISSWSAIDTGGGAAIRRLKREREDALSKMGWPAMSLERSLCLGNLDSCADELTLANALRAADIRKPRR